MPKSTAKPPVTILIPETYRQVIANSLDTRLFRHLFANVNGQQQDILRNGELSCAFYVSTILRLFDLIQEGHATVDGLIKDLEKSGWKKISRPKVGCVLLWDHIVYPDGQSHRHVGFYVGSQQAISNSAAFGVPRKHHWTYGQLKGQPKRKVTGMYSHPKIQ